MKSGAKMKVNFWSSTEYSGFLAGLMRELSESGFDARQRFQISEASYRAAKSTPARLWLRFRQYLAYPAQLCAALVMRRVKGERGKAAGCEGGKAVGNSKNLASDSCLLAPEHDLCVVSTNTFYAPLIATYLHPNVVHLVYDLFPEAMIHSGKWKEGTFKVKLVRWITKQTLRRAKLNVFLGQRLQDYVESIHGAVPNAAIISVGADQALFGRSPVERLGCEGVKVGKYESAAGSGVATLGGTGASSRAPTILYCGNFGNMHESETLFRYWNQMARGGGVLSATLQRAFQEYESSDEACSSESLAEAARYVFHCSGPKRAELEAVHAELPGVLKEWIQVGEGLDQADWIRTMEKADVALVTMVPGSETVVMPSKTYSAMMAGQAILAIAPEDSDLVDTLKAADCGWWVEPGDVDGLARVVSELCSDAERLLEKRENAFQYAHAHLGQDALAKEWEHALRAIEGGSF